MPHLKIEGINQSSITQPHLPSEFRLDTPPSRGAPAMDPRQLIQRLNEIKQEGEAIMQQLAAAGVAEEQVMAALQGGPPPPQPGMGAGPGPDLPMPSGAEAMREYQAVSGQSGPRGLPQGMGAPAGLLGNVR